MKSGHSEVPFPEAYSRSADRVSGALRQYLGHPDEKNTREVRASVRRLHTILTIVPKRSRDKETKQARQRCRKLLRATSVVRDIDVISERLSKALQDKTTEMLVNNLREEREEFVGDSMKSAWRLFEQGRAKIGKKESRAFPRWVIKALNELDEIIMEELVAVVRSEGKVAELHSLRKNAKTFRYMLDLLPSSRGSERAKSILKGWQDVLGEIRDTDILIEYLGRARQSKTVKDILQTERGLRHRRYRSFVTSYSKQFALTPSFVSLAGLGRERPPEHPS